MCAQTDKDTDKDTTANSFELLTETPSIGEAFIAMGDMFLSVYAYVSNKQPTP